MTVAELIEALSKFPADAAVCAVDDRGMLRRIDPPEGTLVFREEASEFGEGEVVAIPMQLT